MYIDINRSVQDDNEVLYKTWYPICIKWTILQLAATGQEIEDWINENSKGSWTIFSHHSQKHDALLLFQFEEDAVLYKMRWL